MRDSERKFGFWRSSVFGLVTILIMFTVAELMVRGWAYFYREQYERYDVGSEAFVPVPGEHRRGSTIIRVNDRGFLGEDLRSADEDLIRIVALGDSCTFGPGEYDEAYPALLQDRMDGLADGGDVEVVNAGVEGLNSEMALARLKSEVAPLEPDVVTIYIGWNDLMKLDPMGQSQTNGAQAAVVRWLDRLWLVKGMRKLVFFYLRPAINPPKVGPDSFQGTFTDFRPVVFEENLQEIIVSVRAMGAVPVVLTLPTVVRPDMDVADLKAANVFFPYFNSGYAVGDFLDLVAAYNGAIRRAAEAEDATLVDLAHLIDPLPDSVRYFYDTVHPSDNGRRIIADALASALVEERIISTPSSDRMR